VSSSASLRLFQLSSLIPAPRARSDRPGLLAEHSKQWASEWQQGSVRVSGNHRLSCAINSSLYYLMSSSSPDLPLSLSPGGLASNGTNSRTNFIRCTRKVPRFHLHRNRLQWAHILGLRVVDVPTPPSLAAQNSFAAAAVRLCCTRALSVQPVVQRIVQVSF
jgi:hypothetical protein